MAVCWTGTSPPSLIVGVPGVPGCTSTKKLPSRKIRGRILSSASLWIGRPFLSISIVTRAAPLPLLSGSTSVTFPTSMPAMRTGDLGCRLFAEWKVAYSLKGFANGL